MKINPGLGDFQGYCANIGSGLPVVQCEFTFYHCICRVVEVYSCSS